MAAKHNSKYLTFLLGEEDYGISIVEVKEIIGIMQITNIPKMPEYVKGVINLRGKIISVVDLRLKFGLEERQYDDRTCIIVVEVLSEEGVRLIGFIVDEVSEVLDILPQNMEKISEYASEQSQEFLKGLGKVNDKVVMLLDCGSIFGDDDKAKMEAESQLIEQELELA